MGKSKSLRSLAHLVPRSYSGKRRAHSIGLWKLMGPDTRESWALWEAGSLPGMLCQSHWQATQRQEFEGIFSSFRKCAREAGVWSLLYRREKAGRCHFSSLSSVQWARHLGEPALKFSIVPSCLVPAFSCRLATPRAPSPAVVSHCGQPGIITLWGIAVDGHWLARQRAALTGTQQQQSQTQTQQGTS